MSPGRRSCAAWLVIMVAVIAAAGFSFGQVEEPPGPSASPSPGSEPPAPADSAREEVPPTPVEVPPPSDDVPPAAEAPPADPAASDDIPPQDDPPSDSVAPVIVGPDASFQPEPDTYEPVQAPEFDATGGPVPVPTDGGLEAGAAAADTASAVAADSTASPFVQRVENYGPVPDAELGSIGGAAAAAATPGEVEPSAPIVTQRVESYPPVLDAEPGLAAGLAAVTGESPAPLRDDVVVPVPDAELGSDAGVAGAASAVEAEGMYQPVQDAELGSAPPVAPSVEGMTVAAEADSAAPDTVRGDAGAAAIAVAGEAFQPVPDVEVGVATGPVTASVVDPFQPVRDEDLDTILGLAAAPTEDPFRPVRDGELDATIGLGLAAAAGVGVAAGVASASGSGLPGDIFRPVTEGEISSPGSLASAPEAGAAGEAAPGAPRHPEAWGRGLPAAVLLTEYIELDSERALSLGHRWGDVTIGHPQRVAVDDRVSHLTDASRRDIWDRELRDVRLRGTIASTETVLDDVTRIDIPITFPSAVSSIIGQGANVEVSGSEEITFGGESNFIVEDKDYGFGRRSRFPQLDMRQHLRVNMNGNIGEKIQVLVEHDSETQTPLENRIKLRYAGEEDEVIQSIEMGNTNLSLGGAQFVGYSGQAQGLFGAKMVGRMGNFDFTTIASKQEGRTSRDTFVGQAKVEETTIRDIDYERRRFFSVRLPADSLFLVAYDTLEVDSLSVWVDDDFGDNDISDAAQPGVAWFRIDPSTPGGSTPSHNGMWVPLDEIVDYTINRAAGVISFARPVDARHSVAVSYRSRAQRGRIGDVRADTLSLQMIHPGSRLTNNWSAETPWYPLFEMEIKNVYSLGAHNISQSDYEIIIRRTRRVEGIQPDTQNDTTYINLMGLDVATITTSGRTSDRPDGIVDPEFIDFDAGLLYFQNYRPFAPEPELGRDYELTERVEEIYTQSEEYIRLHPEISRYEIFVRYRTPQTTFRLNRIGIIRDSETVTLNGRRLTRGVDYQIDYDLGQVTFLSEEASHPDAQIAIDFEYAPLLAQAQKTLFGMNGSYRFSEQNRLGVTWLYETSTTPEVRPRLGQEPTRTMLGDVNFQLQHDSERVTRLINAIPLLGTQTPSQVRISGEAASSLPNPNTKNEIYLDDMDGTEDVRSLFATWRSWVPASLPVGIKTPGYRTNWYSPRDLVKESDIFIGLTGIEGDALRTVLEVRPHPDDPISPDPLAWFGIQRLISTDGSNLSQQKFLEVWIDNGPPSQRGGELHIDLGDVNEDFYDPGVSTQADDEDTNRDGILDQIEDVGLDRAEGEDAAAVPADDQNDDFEYEFETSPHDYEGINGFERNRIRDSEDLNRNGNLDTQNRYFNVGIDLSDETSDAEFLAVDNADSLTEKPSHWRLFRIPLDRITPDEAPGATWSAIRSVRVWFTGFQPGEAVQLGGLDIVGNAWLEDSVRVDLTGEPVSSGTLDDRVSIQVRNNKEHSEYIPPFDPGTEQTPQGRLTRREQSLALVYTDLDPGNAGSAHKTVVQTSDTRMNDYSEYQDLSFYVRANRVEPAGSGPVFFVRVGADSANFYEYRRRISDDDTWQTIDVPLGELPLLKLDDPATTLDDPDIISYNGADSLEVRDPRFDLPPGSPVPDGFAVYGKPSLTRVLYLAVGLRNDYGVPISGELWVDELRLKEVRKEPGLAAALNGSVHFADVLDMNATYTLRDSEFRTLGGERSGADDRRLSYGGRLNLHKFFDFTGFALPLSFNRNENDRNPRLLTGSDIVLNDALKAREATLSDDESYTLGLSHPKVSRTAFGRLFIDGISASASYGTSEASSPEQESSRKDERAGVQYLVAPPWDPRIRIWPGLKLAYFPQSVTLRADGSRVTEQVYSMNPGRVRGPVRVDRVTRAIEGSLALRVTPLEAGSMSTDYSFEMHRDLDENKNEPLRDAIGWGNETQRRQTVGWRFQPGLFGLVTPLLTYSATYDEDQRAQIRREDDPPGLRRVSNSGEFRATASVSPGGALRRLDNWFKERAARKARDEEAMQSAPAEAAPVPADSAGMIVPPADELPPGLVPPFELPPDEPSQFKGAPSQPVPTEEPAPPLGFPPLVPPGEGGLVPAADSTGAPVVPGMDALPGMEGVPGMDVPRTDAGAPLSGPMPAAGEQAVEPQPSGGEPPVKGPSALERVTNWSQKVADLSVNFSHRRGSRYERTLARPSIEYQLGILLDAPGEDRSTLVGQTSSSKNLANTLSLRSGIRPLPGLNIDGSYSNTNSKQIAMGADSETKSRTWPEVTLNISSLEKLGPLDRLVERASFTSTLRHKVDTNLSAGEVRDEKTQTAFSPLFQVTSTLRNSVQLTLSGTHTRSSGINRRGLTNEDRSTSSSVTFGARYSFRSKKGINLLPTRGADQGGEVKLSTDLRVGTDQSERKVGTDSRWEVTGKSMGFSIEPSASYTFGSNITGSAEAHFGQNKDQKRGETRRRIGLFLTLSVRF